MSHILRIDASARTTDSHSRRLGDYFVHRWLAEHPDDKVTLRDLASSAIEQIRQPTITGFYTPPDDINDALIAATALSDTLISEVQAADVLLITTPMYNFTVPASLKSWIDQVVRIGHTFSYDGESFGGLVNAKQAYVVCAYGATGYLPDDAFASANFLEPYLRFLLMFLGIEQVDFVSVEATTGDPNTVNENLSKAKASIVSLIQ